MTTNDIKSTTYTTDIKHEALYYVSKELPIIPLCSSTHEGIYGNHLKICKSPGKTPLIKAWSTRQKTTQADVYSWFAQCQSINIGLPLGQVSGLVGIDIDGAHGEKMLQEVSKGNIPKTWEFNTGKGRRLLYRLPGGIKTKKSALAGEGEHQEFAIICDGQQTVMPPSVHASGRIYRWKESCGPKDIELADAPQWIIDKIKVEDETTALPEGKKLPEDAWKETLEEGRRNDELTKRAGSLIGRGMPKDEVKEVLILWNKLHCKPPLHDEEIITIVESIALAEEMKRTKKITKKGEVKVVFRPTPFIKLFINQQKELGYSWKYATDMGSFFRCNDLYGPWERLDLVFVKSELRKALKDEAHGGNRTWDSNHCVDEAIEALKSALVSSEEGLFDLGYATAYRNARYDPLSIICLSNGVFYWKEKKLKQWNSDFYTTIKLPVEYNPEATCPNWLKALSEWIPDENSIKFLQEFIGLCLIPDTSFRTAVILYGTGSNGKSIFIDAIKMLFGKALVGIPLHKLTNTFETAYLQNKLVNVCGDIDAKYIKDTGIIKTIIGGDIQGLRGEFKHGKSFDFTPVCRLLFSANTLPQVADKTRGWFSRWKFIEFPTVFPVNPAYKIKLDELFKEEKSGILNWALEGLTRLKKTNTWTVSKIMEDSANEYRRENDSVVAFLQDTVEVVPYQGGETKIATTALHNFYSEWLSRYMEGLTPVGQIEFTKRVQTYGFKKDRRIEQGRMRAVFLGMRIRIEYKNEFRQILRLLNIEE